MDNIKYFFECLIPITACDIKCHYCYVVQRDNRKMKMADMKYSPDLLARNALEVLHTSHYVVPERQ